MANIRELTKAELLEIARGIANGESVIDMAARLGVDRSSLSGWLKRDGFLDDVAAALSSPLELGDSLGRLGDPQRRDSEREDAYLLRMEFFEVLREVHGEYFEEQLTRQDRNAECARADQKFTIDAMILLEDRGWEKGTADERKRGLNTKRLRRSHRCKNGIVWDWEGMGCWFQKRWSGWKCRLRYADEDGMDFLEQQRLFGTDWGVYMASECSREDLEAVNTRPLEVNRDPRLPTTLVEARAFLEAVQGGADFAEATQKTTAPSSSTGRNRKGT